MRYLLAGIALLISPPVLAADGERAFGRQMLEALRAALPGELRTDPRDPLAIQMKLEGEWDNGVINTHRLHAYCQTVSREDCNAAITEFVSNISTGAPEPAAADLRLIVRDKSYLDYLLQAGPEDGGRPLVRSIGEDLFAIVAFDGPNTISLALGWQLRDLGIDEQTAWQLATAQTKAVLPPLPTGADLVKNAMAFEEYEYLPSLLADIEAWQKIVAEVGPDLFVTAVSDHFVFVGLMPDGPGFERFRHTVSEDCAVQQRCVSPNIYRFREGRWVIAD